MLRKHEPPEGRAWLSRGKNVLEAGLQDKGQSSGATCRALQLHAPRFGHFQRQLWVVPQRRRWPGWRCQPPLLDCLGLQQTLGGNSVSAGPRAIANDVLCFAFVRAQVLSDITLARVGPHQPPILGNMYDIPARLLFYKEFPLDVFEGVVYPGWISQFAVCTHTVCGRVWHTALQLRCFSLASGPWLCFVRGVY